MTPREFKAWFEGFTEAFDRIPTKAQWARVKERVAEIDGRETTERVYVDRYHRYFNTYPSWVTYTGAMGISTCQTVGGNAQALASQYQGALQGLQGVQGAAGQNSQFSSLTAMNALGRAEAQSLGN